MSTITEHAPTQVESLARQTGFSCDAVASMRASVARGGGRMAQFDHPEFGGSGQWMNGGMLMISDWSNRDLERRVRTLCEAVAEWIEREPAAVGDASFQRQSQGGDGAARVQDSRDTRSEPGSWYPSALGTPDSSGSQNEISYAWFADQRRLAIDDGDAVTVYDTGDHRIGGVAQQQGSTRSMSFVSQYGTVDVDRLPVVNVGAEAGAATGLEAEDVHRTTEAEPVASTSTPAPATAAGDVASDPFVALEKLAALHAAGILDDAEFAAKKTELLARI